MQKSTMIGSNCRGVTQFWCSQKFDFIELAAHFLKLTIDLVTDDTAKVWSMMVNRDVKIREKLAGVFRTQNEMLTLRRDYENMRKSALIGVSINSVQNDTKCFPLMLGCTVNSL